MTQALEIEPEGRAQDEAGATPPGPVSGANADRSSADAGNVAIQSLDDSEKAARERERAAERQRRARAKRQLRELGYRFASVPISREAIGALVAQEVWPASVIENDSQLEIELSELVGRLTDLIAEYPQLAERLSR